MAYGQLLIEKSKLDNVDDDLLDQIFDFMVRDFSQYALNLYEHAMSTDVQMDLCLKMIRKPVDNADRFERIWRSQIDPLKGAYEMNP